MKEIVEPIQVPVNTVRVPTNIDFHNFLYTVCMINPVPRVITAPGTNIGVAITHIRANKKGPN